MSAVEGFHRVLQGLLDDRTRQQVSEIGEARQSPDRSGRDS